MISSSDLLELFDLLADVTESLKRIRAHADTLSRDGESSDFTRLGFQLGQIYSRSDRIYGRILRFHDENSWVRDTYQQIVDAMESAEDQPEEQTKLVVEEKEDAPGC